MNHHLALYQGCCALTISLKAYILAHMIFEEFCI